MFLKLRPSPLLFAVAALAWLTVCVCWWLLPLPLPLRLAVVLAASALAIFSLAPLRRRWELVLRPSGAWALREGDGDWRAVELRDALISPFFLMLHFRERHEGGGWLWPGRRPRFLLPITVDALAFDDFCQLRARLRTTRPSGGAGSQSHQY